MIDQQIRLQLGEMDAEVIQRVASAIVGWSDHRQAQIIQDWADTDTDTAVRETCRKAGIDVDGTPAHVPDIPELVERLAKENAKLRDAADAMFAALNDCREDTCELIAERDWWKDEPRCRYDVRYQEMKDRLNAAITALAAYQATKPA